MKRGTNEKLNFIELPDDLVLKRLRHLTKTTNVGVTNVDAVLLLVDYVRSRRASDEKVYTNDVDLLFQSWKNNSKSRVQKVIADSNRLAYYPNDRLFVHRYVADDRIELTTSGEYRLREVKKIVGPASKIDASDRDRSEHFSFNEFVSAANEFEAVMTEFVEMSKKYEAARAKLMKFFDPEPR